LKHINHIKELLGSTENIAIASDDMGYYITDTELYKYSNVFNLKTMSNELDEVLCDYTEKEREGIKQLNAMRFLNLI
jgi:microsomal dipeptidase-like Zn-dependent dipeptidase